MRSGTLRVWKQIHRWTSIVCTLFMLMLCVTGLPLIFNHEINDWMLPRRPAVHEESPAPKVETIIERAARARPGERVNYAYFDDQQPMVLVATAPRADSSPDDTHYQLFDRRDGFYYDRPQPRRRGTEASGFKDEMPWAGRNSPRTHNLQA